MKTLAIIPARYDSTRFRGKPLANIAGKPMIQWVWEAVKSSKRIDRILIATDNDSILSTAKNFGAEAIMTPAELPSGTDRIAYVVKSLSRMETPEITVNVQGDEPLLKGFMIDELVDTIEKCDAPIATIVALASQRDLFDANTVKAVCDLSMNALYFSRAPVPFHRDSESKSDFSFLKHIGVYAFRTDALIKFSSLPQGTLEKIEKLEQLRALENGWKIRCVLIPEAEKLIGIDTPDDLEKVRNYL